MAHGDAVGDRNGAEFAGGAAGGRDALLDRLRLAHQRDIAGRGLVPAGRDADEGLVDLLSRQTHRIEIGPMGGALRPLRHVTARQSLLDVGLGVHSRNLIPQPSPCRSRGAISRCLPGLWLNQPLKEMVSWRGVAKKRRKQETAGVVNQMLAHCCGLATIVAWRQPLFGSIEPAGAARLDGLDFESPCSRPRHNLSAIAWEISPRLRLASSHAQLICRHASPRIAGRDSKRIPAAADRSKRPACDVRSESYDA